MATTEDMLIAWLTRIEEKLDQNSKETTEIRVRVFNGMSHQIAETNETIRKLQDELIEHIKTENAWIAKHEATTIPKVKDTLSALDLSLPRSVEDLFDSIGWDKANEYILARHNAKEALRGTKQIEDDALMELKFWWKQKKVLWSVISALAIAIFWLVSNEYIVIPALQNYHPAPVQQHDTVHTDPVQ